MARVRTGPRGHEAHDRDIGDAAAGVDGLSALGRLSALRVPGIDAAAVAVGAGPIERRMATPEELAAIAARDARPPVLRPPSHGLPVHLHRQPARPAAPPRPEEEPVTAIAAPPAIPCGSCLHEPVCALKRELPKDPAQLAEPMILGPGLRLVTTGVRVECDHYLGDGTAPQPIRREHGGESWRTPAQQTPAEIQAKAGLTVREASIEELTPRGSGHRSSSAEREAKTDRARRVTEALERHGGDKYKAATELGMPVKAVVNVAKNAHRWLPTPAAVAS